VYTAGSGVRIGRFTAAAVCSLACSGIASSSRRVQGPLSGPSTANSSIILDHITPDPKQAPLAALQGALKSQELPLPTTTLKQGHLQNLAELWQALGGRVRAALNYTV
jgi:hypothetical protein